MRRSSSASSSSKQNLINLVACVFILVLVLVLFQVFTWIGYSIRHGHKHVVHIHSLNANNKNSNNGGADTTIDEDFAVSSVPDMDVVRIQQETVELNSRFDSHFQDRKGEREKVLQMAREKRRQLMQNRNNNNDKMTKKGDDDAQDEKAFAYFKEVESSLEQEHATFLQRQRKFEADQNKNKMNTKCSSSSSSKNEAPFFRLLLIIQDLYIAVDSYFECSFGYDELRPFQCTGYNWPSQVELETELDDEDSVQVLKNEAKKRRAVLASEKSTIKAKKSLLSLEKSSGLLLTLIDSLTTLILADDAVQNFLFSTTNTNTNNNKRENDNDECKSTLSKLLASTEAGEFVLGKFYHNDDASSEKLKNSFKSETERKLFQTGMMSSTTILTVAAILEQLEHRWFLYNLRYLSLFELNIRILGALLSAGDLFESLYEKQQHHRSRFEIFKEVSTDFRKLALKIGNSFTRSFSSDIWPISNNDNNDINHNQHEKVQKYGLTNRYFRTSDSASSSPPKMFNLAELGTFDLEFIRLSQISGCNTFRSISENIVEFLDEELQPPQSYQRLWKRLMLAKQKKEIGELKNIKTEYVSSSSNKKSTMMENDQNEQQQQQSSFDTGLKTCIFDLVRQQQQQGQQQNPIMTTSIVPEKNMFSVGAYGDSYYEYRLKKEIMLFKTRNKKNGDHHPSATSLGACPVGDKDLQNDDDKILRNNNLRVLLHSIRNLLVSCFKPAKNDYFVDKLNTRSLGEDDREIIENHQRCFVNSLVGSSSKTHKMSHLSCFVGGLFALAAASEKDLLNIFDSEEERQLFLQVSRGIALTCSDMSRLTEEGVAGEVYKAILSASNDDNNQMNEVFVNEDYFRSYGSNLNKLLKEEKFDEIELDESSSSKGRNQPHLLRPEALESMFYASAATSIVNKYDDSRSEDFASLMRDEAWRVYSSMRRKTRNPKTGGWSSMVNVRNREVFKKTDGEQQFPEIISELVMSSKKNNQQKKKFSQVYKDVMPSYFLAETIKYSMFLQVDQKEVCQKHDVASSSSLFIDIVCSVPKGEEFVLNTEAHPLKIT